jgi:nicotinamide-nucleotide amidase
MKPVAVYSIGEELLEGSVTDTNSAFIAQLLSDMGLVPRKIETLPDDIDIIAREFSASAGEYSVITVTGGLGPTFDDLTLEAAAKAFSLELEENRDALRHIEARLAARGLEMTEAQRKQALFPKGGAVIINNYGTACALRLEANGSVFFFLPGVPIEMRHLMTDTVAPYIRERFALKDIFKRDLLFRSMPESYGDKAIRSAGFPEGVRCIINILPARKVVIKVRAAYEYEQAASAFIEKVIGELNEYYTGDYSGESAAQRLEDSLIKRNISFTAAESCTGGLASARLTEIPGVSKVFKGSVVSYSNEIKESILGVPAEILEKFTAVSRETAIAMLNVRKIFASDAAVSVTGYAGGSETTDPVGTVFIAAALGDKIVCEKNIFTGDRNEIREQAAESALELALCLINGEK